MQAKPKPADREPCRHAPLSDNNVSLSLLRHNGTNDALFFVGKYLKTNFSLCVRYAYPTPKQPDPKHFHHKLSKPARTDSTN